jgi:hypothetical protein
MELHGTIGKRPVNQKELHFGRRLPPVTDIEKKAK